MNPIRRYRNITVRRLVLDLIQFLRAQPAAVQILGRQFERSRSEIEIDITYKCNLKCLNCNRSCTQLPSEAEMSLDQVAAFVDASIATDTTWKRIRLLGGEPTLHSRIFDVVELLREYRYRYNPTVRIVLCTNARGRKVNAVLAKLPPEIEIKSAIKTPRKPLFRPFNLAPVDTPIFRFSDFTCGCRILEDCGLGLTPSGYYACAVAGGIDRVFGFEMGRRTLPDAVDTMMDQLDIFCRLCGHFGFRWPVKRQRISPTWQRAYADRTAAAPVSDSAARRSPEHQPRQALHSGLRTRKNQEIITSTEWGYTDYGRQVRQVRGFETQSGAAQKPQGKTPISKRDGPEGQKAAQDQG